MNDKNLSALSSLQKAYYTIKRQEQEIASLKNKHQKVPIAIVGMACRFPGNVNNEDSFWELLKNGESAIEEIPFNRWDKTKLFNKDKFEPGKTNSKWGGFVEGFSDFDPEFFNISREELSEMDPQQRLLMLTSYEALENSGSLTPEEKEILGGVFVGIGGMDHGFYLSKNMANDEIGPYLGSGNAYSAASGRLSNMLNWTGPAVSYDTACSSSLVSVHYACMHLAMNDCNIALAGGVNVLLSEGVQISLSKAGMLASDGKCKTFDKKADGYVRGEGCGMIVLKRLDDAIRDKDTIRAVIHGSAISQDGKSGGLTVPNRTSQEYVIKRAIKNAGISFSDIQYVEAHGTGTSLGDPIEVDALSHVLSQKRNLKIPIGSVKTNIGHLEAAAGIAGIIKVVLALEKGIIPAHLNCNTPSDLIDWDKISVEVCQKNRSWVRNKEKYAGVSSFGFAGTIGHMILKEAPKLKYDNNVDLENEEYDLVVSAKTKKALQDYVMSYKAFLQKTNYNWADICYSAGNFRPTYKFKTTIRAKNIKEALEKIDTTINEEKELKLPIVGKKIVLPNYPFQTSPFLKYQENQIISPIIEPQWTLIPNYKKLRKKDTFNAILIDSEYKSNKRGIASFIGLNPKTKVVGKSNWSREILSKNYFNGESHHLIYSVTEKKLDNNKLLDVSWEMISGIANLMEKNPESSISMFLIGKESALMSMLCGVLKTVILENPKFKFKQFIIDDGYTIKDSDFQLFNHHHAYQQIKLEEEPKFLQLKPTEIKSQKHNIQLLKEKTYIISGGLGSLGRELADFLNKRGATKIWLLSRSNIKEEKNTERKRWFNENLKRNNELKVLQCDCSLEKDLENLHKKIITENISVGGIFHVAGMNKQQLLKDISKEDFELVMKAKVIGAKLLDNYSRTWKPDYFVMYSSIASIFGSSHLAHYAGANGFLDGLVHQRNKENLPGICINWSAWKGSHMLEMNSEGMQVLQNSGVAFLEKKESLKTLEYLMQTNKNQVVVCNNNWGNYLPLMEMSGENKFWDLLRVSKNEHISKNTKDKPAETIESKEQLITLLKTNLIDLLKYPKDLFLEEDKPFVELGVDSILAVRFMKKINGLLAMSLSTNVVFNYPNLENLASHIYDEITKNIEPQIIDQKDNNADDWLSEIERDLQNYDI